LVEVDPPNRLWSFSLALYSCRGVPESCIALQDECNVDVNVLFLLLWLSAGERTVSSDEVAAIDASISDWRRNVVMPLRGARRSVPKEDIPEAVKLFRKKVKTIELESERIQQDKLFSSFKEHRTTSNREDIARKNLENYSAYLVKKFPEKHVDNILAAYCALRTS